MVRKLITLLSISLMGFVQAQQTKEQLQKQNTELKKQIGEINNMLAKTRDESKLSVAYLDAVNKKIRLREQVLQNTQKEKRFIEDDI